MNTEDVLSEFRAARALREGHFVLSSGLHSPVFLQKNLVFMDAARTERLCHALARKAERIAGKVDVVISPAVGGIIPGYEVGRQLGVPSMYVEREGGAFRLRRGFGVAHGARVLMVEDIVTTGLSSRECIAAIRKHPGELIGAACLIDRSNGAARCSSGAGSRRKHAARGDDGSQHAHAPGNWNDNGGRSKARSPSHTKATRAIASEPAGSSTRR